MLPTMCITGQASTTNLHPRLYNYALWALSGAGWGGHQASGSGGGGGGGGGLACVLGAIRQLTTHHSAMFWMLRERRWPLVGA